MAESNKYNVEGKKVTNEYQPQCDIIHIGVWKYGIQCYTVFWITSIGGKSVRECAGMSNVTKSRVGMEVGWSWWEVYSDFQHYW